MRRNGRIFWKKHCRTVCPSPEIMLRDPETATREEPAGFPFYKRGHEDLLRTQLVYICRGLLSDPPGLCLYTSTARYKNTGLEIFKCHRGPNMLEGFHTDLQVRRRTLLSTRVGNTYISYSLTLSDSLSSSFCFIGSSSRARPRGNMPVRTF